MKTSRGGPFEGAASARLSDNKDASREVLKHNIFFQTSLNMITPLHLNDFKQIVVLTGAGVSAASGLRTYRGPDGLWNQEDQARFSQVETLHRHPEEVWSYFGAIAKLTQQAKPNAAHHALAALERSLMPDQRFMLVTQNIDSLHQAAGSRQVVEYHGSLRAPRCARITCGHAGEPADWEHPTPPKCPRCHKPMRPDIVLFGEPIPTPQAHQVKLALRECDLFIAVGTSGSVYPAANFVRSAEYAGARTIYVNLEPIDPPNPYFKQVILGRAEEVLPELLGFKIDG